MSRESKEMSKGLASVLSALTVLVLSANLPVLETKIARKGGTVIKALPQTTSCAATARRRMEARAKAAQAQKAALTLKPRFRGIAPQ
jgi:hypothetical protein